MDRMNSVNAAGSCTNSWERLSQKGSLDDSSIAITGMYYVIYVYIIYACFVL